MLTAEYWIKKLQLTEHPEGGYFREMYRSSEFIAQHSLPKRYSGDRAFSTSIYFLLNHQQVSLFHRLKSDELWHFYSGTPLRIYIIESDETIRQETLGTNFEADQKLQITIPFGHWFGAECIDKNSYSLIGCSVSPGFEFDDFELGTRKHLLHLFPKHRDIINRFTA